MSNPVPAPAVEQTSVDVFLRTLLGSGIITTDGLQQALQAVPSDRLRDADFVADHLVKVGKLSRFQAGKLLQGITKGLVLGPFQLMSPIGKGGMGAVYLARDTRNGGLVAVKVLPPKKAKAEERLVARFRREMEICQQVDHPYLTRTMEAGTDDNVHYIVMEYIAGQTLYKLVTEHGTLAVGRAARLFSEVAIGMEYAHGRGLIHRDLKPSNIMVTPNDRVKVLDLGLALIQGEVASDRTVVGGAGYVVGTLDYLAPEQADDASQVDPRSDIYSLGCALYFTLTRQAPFAGGNALQKLLRHRCDEPTALVELNAAIPPEFAAIVRRMMAKKKEDRFANAADLRQALTPWCDRPVDVPLVKTAPMLAPPSTAEPTKETAPEPKQKQKPKAEAETKPKAGSKPKADSKPPTEPKLVAESKPATPEATPPDPPKPVATVEAAVTESLQLKVRRTPTDPTPIAPVATLVPESGEPAPPAIPMWPTLSAHGSGGKDLPFWLDFVLPVSASALVLLTVWLVGVFTLLRR